VNYPDHFKNGGVRVSNGEIKTVELVGFGVDAAVRKTPNSLWYSFGLVERQVVRQMVV
jgi:hypothetical protein